MTDNDTDAVVEPTDEVDEPTVDTVDEPTVDTVDGEPAQAEEDVVVENPLSDTEREAQERQEAQAAELGPGETLPWVAEPPSGVALERAIEAAGGEEAEDQFPADEDAEGVGSDIDSSRSDGDPENLPTQETETEDTRST